MGGALVTTPLSARYARQVSTPGVGPDGQEKLRRAKVLCIGAGGLGSPAAVFLAGAGVGMLGLVDDDRVEVSNLHRQIAHTTGRIGEYKVDSAHTALEDLNPDVEVRTYRTRLTSKNALELLEGYDLVLDGSDDFATRYIVSDATTVLGIPHVWASVLGTGGQMSVFHAPTGPVYRDLFPAAPPAGSVPSCAQAGVLGTVPGILGTAMAAEALKLILGIGTPLIGTVAIYDMLTAAWDRIPLAANPGVRRPASAAEIGADVEEPTTAEDLAAVVERGTGHDGDAPGSRRAVVLDVREPEEFARGAVPGARNIPVGTVEADPDRILAEVLGDAEAASVTEVRGASAAGGSGSAGTEIWVYCQSGIRSARAAEALRTAPTFPASGAVVRDVAGGYGAWERRIAGDAIGSGSGPDSTTNTN
ncbi:ThiF family adenylyltransferase [Brevibacterium samyangense]|uniref:ThiF family adenylyltransferase n=1 Tax=Brevibacterium samyangense TaxID=366888 RepID=UPI0031E3121A